MDKSMESHDHNYIMEPVCTSALLKRNCSKEPLRSRQTPRLECDIQLETIPLKLSQVNTNCSFNFQYLKERLLRSRVNEAIVNSVLLTVLGCFECPD